MGRRKSRRKASAGASPAAPAPKPLSDTERALRDRANAHKADWARRHPALARAERRLRKDNIAIRESWKHKRNGTPETWAHAARTRQGALARLYQSGAIDADMLAAGSEIAMAAQLIMRDADLRTASLETRVDVSRFSGLFHEKLGLVWLEAAYSDWRAALGGDARLVLAIILEDIGIARAAARHHMHVRRARALLIDALGRWIDMFEAVRKRIDRTDLLLAQHAALR